MGCPTHEKMYTSNDFVERKEYNLDNPPEEVIDTLIITYIILLTLLGLALLCFWIIIHHPYIYARNCVLDFKYANSAYTTSKRALILILSIVLYPLFLLGDIVAAIVPKRMKDAFQEYINF